MYGKHFRSMYEGSMYGAGIAVFAVWGYVISSARNSRVELNPKVLANTLGATREEIEGAIEVLTSPDPDSRHKEHEGRRLLREGQFQYFIPSWEIYQRIRNEEERREYNRAKKAEERAKKRANGHTVRPEHRDDARRKVKLDPRGATIPQRPAEREISPEPL